MLTILGIIVFKLVDNNQYRKFDLKITLKPSFRCNQACWFCEEYDNSSYDWSLEDCNSVLELLKKIPEDKKDIFIYFYGGEPTLSKYWEYLHYEISEIFSNRNLFIQTQTNLSIDKDRLRKFFLGFKKNKNHTIDICSSYHLNKQSVYDFAEKMSICDSFNSLGYCFFNTDSSNEKQFLKEFMCLVILFNDKIKLRFTEVGPHLSSKKEYKDYNKSDFKYFINKYPEFEDYFEKEFTFDVDGKIYNFSEAQDNKLFNFRTLKCECGTKNMVIDNNLKVYHCNDDFKHNTRFIDIKDFNEQFLCNVRCLQSKCNDGLEFMKWR